MADNLDIKHGKRCKQDNLQYAVECNQDGAVIAVAARQISPDEDHGNATCNAHEDESFAEVLPVGQESPSECYHEERCDDPVEHKRDCNLDPEFAFLEEKVQSFVADFAEDRVHHD
jgi:hypothetical protein